MKNRKSGSTTGGSRKSAGKNKSKGQAAVGAAAKDAPSASRRRFVLGGAAAAPVIVTLASRPALANVCTVSGTLSGNMSRPDAVDCRGLSPEYWRTHPGQWTRYVPGPCNPFCGTSGTCTDYSVPSLDDLADAVEDDDLTQGAVDAYLLAPKGTKFSTVFGLGLAPKPKLTLMQVLWGAGVGGGHDNDADDDDDDEHHGGHGGDDDDDDDDDDDRHGGCSENGGPATVLAHAVAAVLNSNHFGAAHFGFTEGEIVHMVATMISGGQESQLLADLIILNSRG